IGWYWARPTRTVREFFARSLEIWEKTHKWDQAIMNDVRYDMMQEGSLAFPKIVVLNYSDYETIMLVDWGQIYVNQSRIDDWNNKLVALHYTMLFKAMKTTVAKHFGHWFVADYYTSPPQLLQPINF